MTEPLSRVRTRRCGSCNGMQSCEVYGERAIVTMPNACATKDHCENQVLAHAGIEPVRDHEGNIVR